MWNVLEWWGVMGIGVVCFYVELAPPKFLRLKNHGLYGLRIVNHVVRALLIVHVHAGVRICIYRNTRVYAYHVRVHARAYRSQCADA